MEENPNVGFRQGREKTCFDCDQAISEGMLEQYSDTELCMDCITDGQ